MLQLQKTYQHLNLLITMVQLQINLSIIKSTNTLMSQDLPAADLLTKEALNLEDLLEHKLIFLTITR